MLSAGQIRTSERRRIAHVLRGWMILLLLALPLVPRHDACPAPLPSLAGEGDAADAAAPVPPHPFAALSQLKKKNRG